MGLTSGLLVLLVQLTGGLGTPPAMPSVSMPGLPPSAGYLVTPVEHRARWTPHRTPRRR